MRNVGTKPCTIGSRYIALDSNTALKTYNSEKAFLKNKRLGEFFLENVPWEIESAVTALTNVKKWFNERTRQSPCKDLNFTYGLCVWATILQQMKPRIVQNLNHFVWVDFPNFLYDSFIQTRGLRVHLNVYNKLVVLDSLDLVIFLAPNRTYTSKLSDVMLK